MTISLGALLADVPHTRPVQIIGTASDPELIDRFDLQRSRYEGPTGIVGVLHDAMTTAGHRRRVAVGRRAAVRRPGAVAEGGPGPRPAGVQLIGSPPPADALTAAAAEYDARVAALIADDEDLVEYVTRLESLVDDELDDSDDEHPGRRHASTPQVSTASSPRSSASCATATR